ncbi:YggT family protein [Candidatus Pelagibacter sp.]|nr:YggT family protein [Candidatus Pelagibacter sp.]
MQSLLILFDNLVSFFIWILIINVVLSWLIGFSILNAQNKFVYLVYEFSYKITAPPLNIIRRYLPNFGSIDISPVLLIFLLYFIRNLMFEYFS